MYENTIYVEPGDQRALRRFLVTSALPAGRVLLFGLSTLLFLLMMTLAAASGHPLGLVMVGFTGAGLIVELTFVAALRVNARRSSRTLPLGSPITVRIDDAGVSVVTSDVDALFRWPCVSGADRTQGMVVVRGARNTPTMILPDRALSDDALAWLAGKTGGEARPARKS
ncbi:hypothetical protein [Microbacterium azadirachtae]|uniref:YcxB-like protein domain-containing protein n=1 Tax=Microbacterium azadirachtae TaxID=582680 RepID=A0A0F0LLA1_9MICO|nr:hypothetical protein [Microbacterium azadirachtae]KJL33992.1 hypothetical protein RS86_01429 [Microbacterium azadirachtae]